VDLLRAIARDVGPIVWGNRYWMTWNTILAVVPAVLAVVVFRPRLPLGPLRLAGAGLCLLFLPNAPYVVTDLVHLYGDALQTDSRAAVYLGILPMYAAFIAIGFACYALAVGEIGRWLRTTGRSRLVRPVELGLHALSAVGVLLGREGRLNSWDTFTDAPGTFERAVSTLRLDGAAAAVVTLFLVIWIGHAVTRALATAATGWAQRHLPRPRSAAG
jgi:uncharacterized membrane protein